MKVSGTVIQDEAIDEAISLMKGEFTYWTIWKAFSDYHVPVSDRATDRVLQLLRKAGRIEYVGGKGRKWREL